MITKLNFKNIENRIWEFNTDTCPLKKFEIDGDIRGVSRDHMMDHGEWPTFSYLGSIVVHLEGDLLHNTTEDYIEARMEMLSILIPDPKQLRKNRKWGTLILRYEGDTWDYTNDCRLDGYPEIPMEALSPSVTPFMVSFRCFSPLWNGRGGTKVSL